MRRGRKRPHIEDSPDAGEETFINNSDYFDQNDKSAVEDESQLEQEEKLKQEDNDENVLNDTINSERNRSSPPPGIPEESELSLVKEEPVTSANLPLSASSLLPPPPPDEGSFKQQQATIMLQSPQKRREYQQSSNPPSSSQKDEPRLVIDKLVLINFKSYAGKQVIGPFNASFSSVVGPNGSGKSNVIDSMLFVFGFRALKMRQGKLSELIHNSEGGQNIDFCQVDIIFHYVIDQPDGGSEIVPNTQLIISRKAYRNNLSQYYINQKTSNYSEVTQFLKGKGIDLDHKRFLILQGEVESIAQMKAKAEKENDDGLLEYLEDIIGTSKFKPLIENNLSKVDELNDICMEKETRFELVEKDKNLLEEKKDEALKFLKLEKDLINKKSIKFQTEISEYNTTREVHLEKRTHLDDKLSQEKLKNQELNKEVDEITFKVQNLKKDLSKLYEKKQSLIKQQKNVGKVSISLEEKVKNLTNKIKKAEKTVESLKSASTSAKHKLQSNLNSASHYSDELDDLTKSLEQEKKKLDEIRRELTAKTSEFSGKIAQIQKQLDPWSDKLKDKEGEISLIASEIQLLNNKLVSTERELEEARKKLIRIKTEGKSKEAEIYEAKENLEQAQIQCQTAEETLKHKHGELQNRKHDVSNLRQRFQEALSYISNAQNRNRVLSSLVRLLRSGRLNGFHGRLGDLGTIDDKYDVAISTAAPGLESMVVDTVENAQQCIDYLRKNQLGYANFVCLDKLRKFNLEPIRTPGNPASVKRLYDLIVFKDSRFAPAFYSKMYNTLVATNLQEAKSVAFGAKRWKVVTLDGKVVDTSGAMSGGGNHVSKGLMKLSSAQNSGGNEFSEDEVAQLRDELSGKESKLNLLTEEYHRAESHLRQLKESIPELEFKISSFQLDIEALVAEKKEVLILCKSLIAQSQNNNENSELSIEIKEKETHKQVLIRERDEIKLQMADFEQQIKQNEELILEAGGVELRLQNSKVDSNKQKIELLTERMNNEKLANRKLENEIKRHTRLLEEAEAEVAQSGIELEKQAKAQQENEEKVELLKKEIDIIDQECDEKQEEVENISSHLEEKKSQINDLKSTEIEIEEKIEKHNSVIAKCDNHIQACQDELTNLIVRDTTLYIDWLDEEERGQYNGGEITQLSSEELEHINLDEIAEQVAELEKYMATVKVDIEVLMEYGKKKSEFESRRSDLNKAVGERDDIKNYCEELKRKRLDEFMEGFNTISMTLKEMYQMITMGGNAELELVDSLDPFSEGILFSVMPPKKSWKNISNLSGGEKTLSSLALVFALHKYKPTPLYVMDEIDAALDFRNVSIVANYIKERTKNAQFIVISLRNNMFELAQQLVGIYKVNNMTRSISMKNVDMVSAS